MPTVGAQSIVMSLSVCPSLCLVYPLAFLKDRVSSFMNFSVLVTCGNTLYTYSFVDAVTFAHNGSYGTYTLGDSLGANPGVNVPCYGHPME